MDEKKKWEDKYNFYKDMIENGEKGGEENEIEGLKGKIPQYKREQAAIQDTISKQYRDYQKMIQDTIKQIQKKEKNVVLKKEQYKKLPVIKRNMKTIKKLMEERSVYQELLDEIEAKKERRSGLQEEKSRLEAELKELMEIEEYCNNALKNPKATAEQKENARRKLEEINKNKNKNNEAFVKNQKNFEEELKKNGVEVPENDETELKDNIEKLDRLLEALFDGKSIGDYRRTLENDKRGINVTTPQKTEEPAAEPMVEEPVVEKPAVEPVVEEPIVETEVGEPVVSDNDPERRILEAMENDDLPPLEEESQNNQPNTDGKEEETATQEPTAEQTEKLIIEQPEVQAHAQQQEETTNDLQNQETSKTGFKLIKVKKDGKFYTFYDENKEGKETDRVYRKLALTKNFKERLKLLSRNVRHQYNISFITALKADVNILNHLEDNEKEAYLNYLDNPEKNERPFEIEYTNPNIFYARVLKRLEQRSLPNGQTQNENENRPRTLDEKFGKGFDQHDNNTVEQEKSTKETIAKNVKYIMNKEEQEKE